MTDTGITPDERLRAVMKQHGLRPREILADGCLHEFAVSDKAQDIAWYIVAPGWSTAEFGHPASGVEKIHWYLGKWRPHLSRESGDDASTRPETSSDEAEKMWKQAKRRLESHPYFTERSIVTDRSTGALRVTKKAYATEGLAVPADTLLIPMRFQGGQLVNLQLILPDGTERFLPDAPVHGTWTLVGGDALKHGNRTLYVCVDWATAWTIHQATGCAAAVVFCAGALRSAAAMLRRRYKCRLVIVADNDRWNDIHSDWRAEAQPNPGVHLAEYAARELKAELAIPDFKRLQGCPTSFDDLRREEGMDAVRSWLDPQRHSEATTTQDGHPAPEPDDWRPPEPDPDPRFAEAPFRCLGYSTPPIGYRGRTYYYVRSRHGFVCKFSRCQFKRRDLFQLARPEWWRKLFARADRPKEIDWEEAIAALMGECHRVGLFDPGRVRRTGCWRDEDGNVVVHLGRRLLAPGATRLVHPRDYHGEDFVYEESHELPEPMWADPLSLAEARLLVTRLESLPWDDEAAGALFAGFLALGPVCGALGFRPHLWITGGGRSARDALIGDPVVRELLAGMCHHFIDSPRDLRGDLIRDASVLTYHWFGENGKETVKDIRYVLRLARVGATDRPVTFATGTGMPRDIQHSCMMLLSTDSVPSSLFDEIGGYINHFHLRDPRLIASKRARRNADLDGDRMWREYWRSQVGRRTGRRLWARTLRWLRSGRLDRLLEVTTAVAEDLLSGDSRRAALQVLAAGALMLDDDAIPEEDQVRRWFRSKGLSPSPEHTVREGHDVLARILGGDLELVRPRSKPIFSVSTLWKLVIPGRPKANKWTALKESDQATRARRALMQAGLRVEDNALLIANQSEWIAKQLAGSPHATTWARALRTIPRAHAGPLKRFGQDYNSRTTVVPLKAVELVL